MRPESTDNLPGPSCRNFFDVLPTGGCRAGSLCAQKSVAEIFEIGADAEIAALYKLDHSLQIVFLFSGDANLSILQLALHFESM